MLRRSCVKENGHGRTGRPAPDLDLQVAAGGPTIRRGARRLQSTPPIRVLILSHRAAARTCAPQE